MAIIKDVTDAHFDAEVLHAPLPVMVDFSAVWCGPCMVIAAMIEELAVLWEGKVKVVKLDVDDNYKTARRYGILTIPTLVLFRGGKPIERIMGVVSKAEIERKVKNALAV